MATKESAIPTSLPAALDGNQLVLEGLISDVLNEHFGEAVELVAVVLYRNGALTLVDIVRICNASFLAFPRDAVNPFNAYNVASASSDSISLKAVRDSLLVLVHYGLVSVATASSPCVYSVLPSEVVNRLCFPAQLALFTDPDEKLVMEAILKRGMMKRSRLVDLAGGRGFKDVVAGLMARRAIRSVDSLSAAPKEPHTSTDSSQDELVVTCNTAELHLSLMKGYMVDYVSSKLDAQSGAVIAELLNPVLAIGGSSGSSFRSQISVGELSVGEISRNLKMSSNELISTLMRLQQFGLAAKKQFAAPPSVSAAAGRKRKAPARALNTKQLLAIAQDEDDSEQAGDGSFFANLLDANTVSGSGPSYTVRFFDLIEQIQNDLVFELVRAKYGVDGARVFEVLSESKQKLESSHIADICAISREGALKFLHALSTDGVCQIQEVPKVVGSAAMSAANGGGLSAMMRAVASSFWLYHVDDAKVRIALLSIVAKSIVNLRRRFRFEVNRQCKIEDRASVLTKVEEEYLAQVHSAQDTLEATGINLVFAATFLLIKTN